MRKKYLCLLLSFIIMLGGCGKQPENESSDQGMESVQNEEAIENHGATETLYTGDSIERVLNGEMIHIQNICTLDLDMDGELDSISLKIHPMEDGYRYECKLTVNDLEYCMDKIILDVKENILPLYLFTPDGEHLALAILARDNSYNMQTYILLYDGQKINDYILFGSPSYYSTEQECLFVDTLVYQIQWHSTTRPCRFEMTDNGECNLRFDKGYSDYTTYDPVKGETKVFVIEKDMLGYADASLNSETIFVEKDTEFVVVGGDADEWILIHILNTDIECWLHISNGFVINDDIEIPIDEYIGNLNVVN